MSNRKSLLILAAMLPLVIGGAVVAVGLGFTDVIVDFWWHQELGLTSFFWQKLLYRYLIAGAVTLFFFLIFFLNFWAASNYLGVDEDRLAAMESAEMNRRQRLLNLFRIGSLRVYAPLALILALAIALPFYQDWHDALLFVFGPASGVKDAEFGRDVSFFLFSLPLLQLIQKAILFAVAVLTVGITLLYVFEHRIAAGPSKAWAPGAKTHLSGMAICFMLILVWGFLLERYQLAYTDAHEPQFFGPGYLEIDYLIPLIWLSLISLIGAVFSGLWYLHQRTGLSLAASLGTLFLVSLGIRHLDVIPEAIERFIVAPNPVKSEWPHMQHNIESTLAAFDLNNVTRIDLTPQLPDKDVLDPELRTHLYNIPVWDHEFLDDVYQQLQGIRPYYHFTDVDVDRYTFTGRLEQVNLAARETNISRLPPAAHNWENTHLRYTHGYGATATPAAQDGNTPMSWYLQDLSMKTARAFDVVEKPDIYFGEENLTYAIVPNRLDLVGIPSEDEASSYNYAGVGGVPISSLFRKLIFALYFKDENLFFSVNITGDSRALFHRNIVERDRELTPFLKLDGDPYLVITPKRLFWVIDAYTTSNWYPASKRITAHFNRDGQEHSFNYIRNSVKVVVDAYDGQVDYYISDTSDPIIQGYRNAYPDLFRDIRTLPPILMEHLRYPKDLFRYQMKIYARYHQTDPALFYEQAETLDVAKVNDSVVSPYYLTTALQNYQDNRQNFVLINPMTPIGRANLSALMVGTFSPARVDGSGGGSNQLIAYRFNRGTQVAGPAQVNALIDQDPEISQQLALWDQRGSRVLKGRMIVLPVGTSVIYVQPIYIVSTSGTRIPELQRIILSMGNAVVMDASLEKGIIQLEQRLKGQRQSMIDQRSGRPQPTLSEERGPAVMGQYSVP